jgi:hypothetical protein
MAPELKPQTTEPAPASKPHPARPIYSPAFEAFWEAFPARNGVKAGKFVAWDTWRRLPAELRDLSLAAAQNYAASAVAQEGYTRDAVRFLKKEDLREWAEGRACRPAEAKNAEPAAPGFKRLSPAELEAACTK